MVFFTCNNCGESVKKPSVEKHYNTKCNNRPINVSCMDCQKDFHGEEYVAHTKCISELEKYSGKNYVAKEAQNSGQKKQESWMDIVRSILDSTEYNLTPQTRNIFQRLQNHDNVPRKKAKFQNFVANCMRIPAKQAEPVWAVLEKELENMKKIRQEELAAAKKAQEEAKKAKTEEATQQNGVTKRKADEETNGVEAVEKKKKKKKADNEEVSVNGNGPIEAVEENNDEFQWSTVLEKIVAKNSDGIQLEKLKKKLMKKYKAKLSLEELSEKQQKKFEKKFSKTLKKCPAIQVDGEVAKPC